MTEQGTITIKLDNVTNQEILRLQEVFHILLSQGVLTLKNGSAILRFDSEGNLQIIELDYIKWKKNKPLVKILEPKLTHMSGAR